MSISFSSSYFEQLKIMACKVGPGSLSKRAEENVIYNEAWREMREALAKPYNKEINPNGMINISLAENYLMHEELAKYMESNFKVDTFQHFTYGGGSNGSKRLLKAMASFFNSHFHPLQPVDESQFIVTAGVASLIDSITWCLCNDGEGILLPQPLYTGFKIDITLRSRGKILPVSFQFDDREYSTSNVFDPQLNRLAMERALKKYTDEGIKVRAVMIANPHNPLGRCYPEETIKELLRFCNEHDLHYVSDEIYANSVWSNRDYPDATQFKSILAIDTKDIIDPRKMHIMYGMSKDFCANGMRLGILHTRSQAMYEAVSSVNLFSWPPYLTQDIWAAILEDEKFLSSFIDTNNQRLEQAYYGFTSFLDELNIPYMKGGNAGFFLWLHLVRPGNHLTNDSVQVIKDNLIKACYERGVFIRDGNVYFPEEKEDGWVRLTFTLDPDVLKVALERLKAALVAVGLLKEQGLPDGAP